MDDMEFSRYVGFHYMNHSDPIIHIPVVVANADPNLRAMGIVLSDDGKVETKIHSIAAWIAHSGSGYPTVDPILADGLTMNWGHDSEKSWTTIVFNLRDDLNEALIREATEWLIQSREHWKRRESGGTRG